jgi:hypothetical protein
MEAIKQRQHGAGVSLEWVEYDPVNVYRLINEEKTDYTFENLVDYVNAIAVNYIEGDSYSGGASAPVMLSSSYANGASDESELYALVCDMSMVRQSLVNGSPDGSDEWRGEGYSNVSWADAKSKAIAAWADTGVISSASNTLVTIWRENYDGYNYAAIISGRLFNRKVQSLYTSIDHYVTIYGQWKNLADASGWTRIFDAQGISGVTEDYWHPVVASGKISAAEYDCSGAYSMATPPPNWTTAAERYTCGMNMDCFAMFAVIKWDFSCK